MMRARGWMPLALGGAAVAFLWAPVLAVAYSDRPPAAHTGGFEEPTCHACHFDQPLDDPAGAVALQGVPSDYSTEESYRLTLLLTRAEMARGGFQLATRFAEGERAGQQAGTLRALDERVQVIEQGGILYAHQTRAGTSLDASGTARWTLEWTPPEEGSGAVVLHLVGNAANGDDSAFGDFIYTHSARSGGAKSK
ncbi:MAG TPA: choice-of-anchor V domain-containing protein [Longimicrobiaceae bacterium]|nr:choice-of-anchor V domain-containing protein [Longimicrobiaceae bacterium]